MYSLYIISIERTRQYFYCIFDLKNDKISYFSSFKQQVSSVIHIHNNNTCSWISQLSFENMKFTYYKFFLLGGLKKKVYHSWMTVFLFNFLDVVPNILIINTYCRGRQRSHTVIKVEIMNGVNITIVKDWYGYFKKVTFYRLQHIIVWFHKRIAKVSLNDKQLIRRI